MIPAKHPALNIQHCSRNIARETRVKQAGKPIEEKKTFMLTRQNEKLQKQRQLLRHSDAGSVDLITKRPRFAL